MSHFSKLRWLFSSARTWLSLSRASTPCSARHWYDESKNGTVAPAFPRPARRYLLRTVLRRAQALAAVVDSCGDTWPLSSAVKRSCKRCARVFSAEEEVAPEGLSAPAAEGEEEAAPAEAAEGSVGTSLVDFSTTGFASIGLHDDVSSFSSRIVSSVVSF